MCDYSTDYLDVERWNSIPFRAKPYKCPHHDSEVIVDGRKLCIFHNPKEDKDISEFYKAFKKLYENSIFSYVGFIFPKGFSFHNFFREIEKDPSFIDANFANALFLCNADFFSTKFYSNNVTNFSGAKFSNDRAADFARAKFSGTGGADFRHVEFTGMGRTDFFQTKFTADKGVNFAFARFLSKGGVRFFMTEFSNFEWIDFSWTTFSGDECTDFSLTSFAGTGGVDFQKATFTDVKTDFKYTTFKNEEGVFFLETNFVTHTSFRHTQFETSVSFSEAVFRDNVEFFGSHLSMDESVNFILKRLSNDDGTFHVFSDKEGNMIDFRAVTFLKPESVFFNMVNLKQALLLNTDLLGVRMGQVDWMEHDGRCVVYDELFADEENTHQEVSHIYKQLRSIYESTGRYFEAGDFFFGEMEMRRKQKEPKQIGFLRILLNLYKLISYYGERPRRALLWLVGLPVAFTPIYLFLGLKPRSNSEENIFNPLGIPLHEIKYRLAFDSPILQSFIASLKDYMHKYLSILSPQTKEFFSDVSRTLFYSISNFTLGRTFTDLAPANNWSAFLTIIENILGVIIIALFVLSINRKLKRTKD